MTDFTPEDYIKYRIARANETIEEVRIHIDNRFWNTAINRMYMLVFMLLVRYWQKRQD
jgi:hypothetical protein